MQLLFKKFYSSIYKFIYKFKSWFHRSLTNYELTSQITFLLFLYFFYIGFRLREFKQRVDNKLLAFSVLPLCLMVYKASRAFEKTDQFSGTQMERPFFFFIFSLFCIYILLNVQLEVLKNLDLDCIKESPVKSFLCKMYIILILIINLITVYYLYNICYMPIINKSKIQPTSFIPNNFFLFKFFHALSFSLMLIFYFIFRDRN